MTEDKKTQEENEQSRPQQEQEEIQELLSRIQAMEAAGQEDTQLAAELARRGVNRQVAKDAWQQHIQDFPEHGHQQEEIEEFFLENNQSLEERLEGVKARKQAGSLYEVADAIQSGKDIQKNDLYHALEQAQTYISEQGGVSDEQYQALNTIQEQGQQQGYVSNDAVESIKKMGRLQIGNDYLQNNQY